MTSQKTSVPTPTIAWPAQPLTLPLYDKWLYASDWHCPSYSPLMVDRLIRVAKKKKVTTLVIGGDLTDQPTISKWPKTVPMHSHEECLDSAGALLSLLGDTFDEVVVLPGNHDDRTSKVKNEYFPLERLLHSCLAGRTMNAKLTTTDHTFIYLGDEGPDWHTAGVVVGHPDFYSSTPAKGLVPIAMIQHRNVIGSHNHIQGLMFSPCGRYWTLDPGCMCDPSNTPYIQRTRGFSKYGSWRQGMVYMQGNVPTLLADGLVNWRDWGAS